MELLLKNRDYVPDGKGGFLRAEGQAAVLNRVLWKLTVRRGSFPFLPDMGSELYTLMREKPSARESLARQYVVQALAEESDLTVMGVELAEAGGKLELTVHLDWMGESLDAKVGLER